MKTFRNTVAWVCLISSCVSGLYNGICNIIAHLIDTVIEPKEKGEYQLIVTYKIADETLIDAVKVVVM